MPKSVNKIFSNQDSGYIEPGMLKILFFFMGKIYYKLLDLSGLRNSGQLPAGFFNNINMRINEKVDTSDIAVWIGHSTVLCRQEGTWYITDPVFSNRASPFSLIGPGRFFPAASRIADLPAVRFVLISHNHYDHLDRKSVLEIDRRFKPVFLVPEGLGDWFHSVGIDNVEELSWWKDYKVGGLTVTSLPARHFSLRAFWDRNRSHWCGWMVSGSKRFYYSGDTGYSDAFREIGDRSGPMDLAVLPIGAYDPRWMMKMHHLTPEEALDAFRDVKGKKMLPVHYAGFDLTYEPVGEPPARLKADAQRKGMDPSAVSPVPIGQPIEW